MEGPEEEARRRSGRPQLGDATEGVQKGLKDAREELVEGRAKDGEVVDGGGVVGVAEEGCRLGRRWR